MFQVLGETKLTMNETLTLLAEISNLLNESPIGIRPSECSCSDYLLPNCLHLSRSTPKICAGPFEPCDDCTLDPKQLKSRFVLVQTIVDQFWTVWQK